MTIVGSAARTRALLCIFHGAKFHTARRISTGTVERQHTLMAICTFMQESIRSRRLVDTCFNTDWLSKT